MLSPCSIGDDLLNCGQAIFHIFFKKFPENVDYGIELRSYKQVMFTMVIYPVPK